MELSEIRTKIDAVDDQLLDLFLERMSLSEEVIRYKIENNLPILNKQREREILAKVMEHAGDKERYAYHLFSTLFELSRSRCLFRMGRWCSFLYFATSSARSIRSRKRDRS